LNRELIGRYGLDLIVPVLVIILAESLIFLGYMQAAMIVHASILVLLVLPASITNNRIYPALMLLSLFRLLNVAMPVFFQLTLYSYSIVDAPVFVPIYFIIKEGFIQPFGGRLTMKGFWFYLPLAVAEGFVLGWGEFNVLHSGFLVPDYGMKSILVLFVIMILFVGLVEEFVFRSALQTVMQERLSSVLGILATSVIFGFMHSGYHLPLEILFVSLPALCSGCSSGRPKASLSSPWPTALPT
jgi:membrane protease YdiL (CAAX protease family)